MVVIGLVFGFLFKEGVGLFPSLLIPSRALLVVSLVSGWAYAGFFMVIFLAALAAIPQDILDAAALDGANGWQTAWRVKVPPSGPLEPSPFHLLHGSVQSFRSLLGSLT